MSIDPREDYVGAGQAYLSRLHPRAAQVYLSTEDQFHILQQVVTKVEAKRARITRLSYVERYTTTEGEVWEERTRKSTSLGLEDAKERFEEETPRFLTRVRMYVRTQEKLSRDSNMPAKQARVGITRESEFLCRGLVAEIVSCVVSAIEEKAAQKLQLFAGRSREGSENLAPRPLAIQYAENIFSTPAVNKRLIHAIRSMPKVSLSVYHPNPYLHGAVLDHMDGSLTDIWVLSGNRIILVPQMRSTFAALERLSAHIRDCFAEGKIVNWSLGHNDQEGNC
jgi:hypothetical protein